MKKLFTAIYLLSALFILGQEPQNKKEISKLETAKNYFYSKNYVDAKKLLEEYIQDNESNAVANYYLAYSHFHLENLEEAIEYCERAVELDAKNSLYHFKLGQLYGQDIQSASVFRMPGLASDIKEQFELAVKFDSLNVDARAALISFYVQAPGIFGGDYVEAERHANILLAIDEYRGRFALAEAYAGKGENEKAEIECKIIEEKFGDDSDKFYFYNVYGYFLMEQDRIDEAIEKFRKQIDLAPENANAHDSLAEAFREKGMLKEALSEYKTALGLNSKNTKISEIIEEIEELLAESNS